MTNPLQLDNTLDITLRIFTSKNGKPSVGYWIIEDKTQHILNAGFAANETMARYECLQWAQRNGYTSLKERATGPECPGGPRS